jgi:hypothetical protein
LANPSGDKLLKAKEKLVKIRFLRAIVREIERERERGELEG